MVTSKLHIALFSHNDVISLKHISRVYSTSDSYLNVSSKAVTFVLTTDV